MHYNARCSPINFPISPAKSAGFIARNSQSRRKSERFPRRRAGKKAREIYSGREPRRVGSRLPALGEVAIEWRSRGGAADVFIRNSRRGRSRGVEGGCGSGGRGDKLIKIPARPRAEPGLPPGRSRAAWDGSELAGARAPSAKANAYMPNAVVPWPARQALLTQGSSGFVGAAGY